MFFGDNMFFKRKEKAFSSGGFEFLIAGLGNPGREYELTRHNAGFLAVDALCEKHGITLGKAKYKALLGEGNVGGVRVLVAKPQTFMNNSGEAVRDIAAFYKIPPERTLVIFDDISLPVGRIRIRAKGSDGGHNGMKNIIYLSGSDLFPRIKIGVGEKPHPDYDLKDWVLSRFKKDEEEPLKTALSNAVGAVEYVVRGNTAEAMNKFNSR